MVILLLVKKLGERLIRFTNSIPVVTVLATISYKLYRGFYNIYIFRPASWTF